MGQNLRMWISRYLLKNLYGKEERMKVKMFFMVFMVLAIALVPAAFAAEHGGEEHGGAKVSEPSADQIRGVMNDYVIEQSKKTGTFDVYDDEAGKMRKLSLVRDHERVGKDRKNTRLNSSHSSNS